MAEGGGVCKPWGVHLSVHFISGSIYMPFFCFIFLTLSFNYFFYLTVLDVSL